MPRHPTTIARLAQLACACAFASTLASTYGCRRRDEEERERAAAEQAERALDETRRAAERAAAPAWQPQPAPTTPPPATADPLGVAPGVVTSLDGLSQLTLPAGWGTTRSGPSDPTHLHARREDANIDVQITTWPKADLVETRLPAYAARRQAKFLELQEAVDSKSVPLELRLDGLPTIANEVHASLSEWKFVYVLVSVEAPKYFFQIAASATPSKYDTHRDEILGVLRSFHVLAR